MEHATTNTRRRSIDALDEAICRLSARMDAACYEQLVLIREFDERAGWLEWSLPSCSDWLTWRCDISLSAAREKVRVAHALLQLPNISQAFAEGRLSYTKVRALTRVSHLRNEGELFRPDGIAVPECGYIVGDDRDRTVGLSLPRWSVR